MPGIAGDRWSGPDVDTERDNVISRLPSGEEEQTFKVYFRNAEGATNYRAFKIKVRKINYSEEVSG